MLASARWEIRYSANEKPGTPYYYRISDGHCQWERPKERGVCIVTASDDNTARVWQLSDGYCLCTLEGHTNLVRSVAVSPDGEYVATASWDTTALACGTNGKCIRTLGGHTGYVNSVVVSPDGMHVVTASSDKTARVWQLSDGTCLHMLKGHTKQVRSAAVSPDGELVVTASHDTTARVWRISDGVGLRSLVGHTDEVWSAVVSPDGEHVITASLDKTARVWWLSGGQRLELKGHTCGEVNSVAVSPDGKHVVTASRDSTARVWRLSDGACLHTLMGHTHWVFSAMVSADGIHVRRDGVERHDGARVGPVRREVPSHSQWAHRWGVVGDIRTGGGDLCGGSGRRPRRQESGAGRGARQASCTSRRGPPARRGLPICMRGVAPAGGEAAGQPRPAATHPAAPRV